MSGGIIRNSKWLVGNGEWEVGSGEWEVVSKNITLNILSKFKPVTTFVFDVDGVLTDSMILVLDDGQWARQMNVKDGYALQLAVKKGYNVVVISGGTSNAVRQRLEKLGVTDCFMPVENKKEKLAEYLKGKNISKEQILFVGDDIPDHSVMQMAGLPCCPADAVSEIKEISLYISPFDGGRGCVRDVIEKVLKLNNDWELDTSVPSK